MAVDPLPAGKGKRTIGILGLQNESVLRETNSGAGVVGERSLSTQKRKLQAGERCSTGTTPVRRERVK